MTTFIDGIVLTQKHYSGAIRDLAGVRSIVYREKGDITRLGEAAEKQELIGERFSLARVTHDNRKPQRMSRRARTGTRLNFATACEFG